MKFLAHEKTKKKGKFSTWREAGVVNRVLNSNLDHIRGRKVKVYSDNKNVQTVLKVGSRKENLQKGTNDEFELFLMI